MSDELGKLHTDPEWFKKLLGHIDGKSAEAGNFSDRREGGFLADIKRASAWSVYDINKFAECPYKWVIYKGVRVKLDDIGPDTYYAGVRISAEDYRP